MTHLQPGDVLGEIRIRSQHLLVHGSSVFLAERRRERCGDGHVHAAIVVYLVDHLNGIRQTNDIHAGTFDLSNDVGHALVLEPFGDHDVGSTGPVGACVGDHITRGINNVPARGGEGAIGPGLRGGQADETCEGGKWLHFSTTYVPEESPSLARIWEGKKERREWTEDPPLSFNFSLSHLHRGIFTRYLSHVVRVYKVWYLIIRTTGSGEPMLPWEWRRGG